MNHWRHIAWTVTILSLLAAASSSLMAQKEAKAKGKEKEKKAKLPRGESTGLAVGENKATPLDRIRVAKGFKVELLYSVPNTEQGSWVNMCLDNKGRFIVSDQYGGLYRFPAPPLGKPLDPAKVEKIPAEIRAANGLLWFHDALYVVVNDYEKKIPCGLYRVTSSKGDDTLDKVEMLRELDARNDHGSHAILPTPDGKGFYIITGDGTKPTQYSATRVPPLWGEDHLLPRMPDGRGFMRDVLGPGGIIYRVDPEGKNWEVYSSGYRNIFDAALNRDGELFTYDADMEYDFNTSWYRPTRVCHVVSGSEFGWRNGAGKWPEFYPDSLPPTLNIGPGSPTGMTFGYGAKFPANYQEAMFILDWSWGKLYAVHLTPSGSSYTATKEDFVTGAPLPLTDVLINPADGAMYFTIGGRKVQSGLYRVTYTGPESTAPVSAAPSDNADRDLRHRLEAFHGKHDPKAVDEAWNYLDHSDRFIRSAARVAIESQPPAQWADRALSESNPAKQLPALLGLTRATGIDPAHRQPTDAPVNTAMGSKILAALVKLDWSKLDETQRITLVRTYEITFNRFGRPDDGVIGRIVAQLDPAFPAASRELNWLLCETLVYLQSPTVGHKAVALIQSAATQEEQIEYARSLRMLKTGWTPEDHKAYLGWFVRAANFRGGASFGKFIEFIRTDAVANLSEEDKTAFKEILEAKPASNTPMQVSPEFYLGRTPTNWTLEELSAAAATGMKGRSFDNGRKVFGAVLCFTCHRFANEGGMTGPDLTGAGGRYAPHDLLDQIINPSKEINEQFVPMVITKTSGETVTGMIVNLSGDTIRVNTDPANPNQQVGIDRKETKSIEPSKVSPMPPGLLMMLKKDEILDLVAYVLSGGNRDNPAFAK